MVKKSDNGDSQKPIQQTSNEEILNAIRNDASPEYKSAIPEANAQNIESLSLALTTYTVSFNEFLTALVNKITKTIISNKMARNKLSAFKKGSLPYGKDVEEIFTDLQTKHAFDQTGAETTVFARELPNTKAIFHRQSRQDYYKTTISQQILKRAFYSQNGLGQLVGTITDSLYSSDVNDEFKLMKELMTEYQPNYTAYSVPAPATDTASTKAIARNIKSAVIKLGFMSNAYNKQGVNTFSDPEDLVLFVSPDLASYMDTELYAYAFNSERIDPKSQVVVVDNFGSGTATTLAKTQAILVDKSWFQVYDTLFETGNIYNPQGLYSNVFLHHHQILSTSQFANAVAFNTP
jgi:hypothetical protein